jgi:hypothetical protein
MTRTGKIARLPDAVREQLNGRLRNGEKGRLLVKWLNSLPEVQAAAATAFGGVPVSECNLSQWKKGGYRDWLRAQEALAEMRRALKEPNGLSRAAQRGLGDHLAFWITARYLMAASRSGTGGETDYKVLHTMCKDLTALRRGELHVAQRESERKQIGEPLRNADRQDGEVT